MNKRSTSGFMLIEIMLVGIILLPLLLAVMSTTTVVSDNVKVTRGSVDAAETSRVMAQRISKILRPASLGSLRAPVNGLWVAPVDDVDYGALQYQIVEALPSSNRQNLGPVRSIEFMIDATETANGIDDDGDGLIDEGKIVVRDQSGAAAVASRVEKLAIRKKGRMLEIEIVGGKQDGRKTTHRVATVEVVYLRNN